MEKAQGRRTDLVERHDEVDAGPKTLSDMGISRDQSSRWQQLADGPDEQFEGALASAAKSATAGIIKAAAQPRIARVYSPAGRTPVQPPVRARLFPGRPGEEIRCCSSARVDGLGPF